MPPEIQPEENRENMFTPLGKVTPLSKYFALVLFIILPIITLYVGAQFGPVEYVEVEKVVYRDLPTNDSVDTAMSPGEDEASTPMEYPLTNATLRSAVLPVAPGYYGAPISEVYLGNTLLLKVSGECNFGTGGLEDLFTTRPMLKALVPSTDAVIEGGTCWFAGGGSEIYRVSVGDGVRVVGMEVSECGALPKTECSGFGEPQVLYEIDSTGVVSKQYSGGVFGG